MQQHTLATAIEVFEREAVEARLAYNLEAPLNSAYSTTLGRILERDDKIERCLWAIELLQDAYKRQTAFEAVLPLQAVAI
jgi:hypothetical protein